MSTKVPVYCLRDRSGKLVAEGDELLAYLTLALARFARKRRGYDDPGSPRFCRIVKCWIEDND